MKNKGFTLTELIIVVAIIGILAAIAIPGYLGQQTRAKREAAVENVQALGAAMELYYQEHNNYGADCADTEACKIQYPSFKPQTNYTFSVDVSADGQGYTTTCVSDDFGSYSSLTMDQNNVITWVE